MEIKTSMNWLEHWSSLIYRIQKKLRKNKLIKLRRSKGKFIDNNYIKCLITKKEKNYFVFYSEPTGDHITMNFIKITTT